MILRTDTEARHNGMSRRYRKLQQIAEKQAFEPNLFGVSDWTKKYLKHSMAR